MFLNRLAVWVLERTTEAVLLGATLYLLTWSDESRLRDLLRVIALTGFVFMLGSGYLITTSILGVVWRSRRWWLHPSCASLLYVTHLRYFATGWSDLNIGSQMQAAGVCIVFACTIAGNHLLKKWDTPAR